MKKENNAQIFGKESWSRASVPNLSSWEARQREGVASQCLVSGQLRRCSGPTQLIPISDLVAGSLGGLVSGFVCSCLAAQLGIVGVSSLSYCLEPYNRLFWPTD